MMNKYFFISILVSVVISGLFSYFLFIGIIRVDMNKPPVSSQVVNYQQAAQRQEVQSIQGIISEAKDSNYTIISNEGLKLIIHSDSGTIYATSFSPTQAESEALYSVATSTFSGKSLSPKLKLKVGDRIEAISDTNIMGKTEFVAKIIKLIR